ncbi:MAG TPA: hypothetical protein VHE54_14340, partial [Puia sp.]|nr:hypothetical protein [Puia sp.]
IDIYARNMNGTTAAWVTSGNTIAQTVTQPSPLSNTLKWERVGTFDVGLDARVLDNHIGVTFDWYQRNTDGMIQPVSVPATFGYTGPMLNLGDFRARGYELSIDANYTVGKDIQLYGSVGLSDYKTVFTKWNNPNLSIAVSQNYVGKTYGEIWGFTTDRYFTDANDAAAISQKALQTGNFVYGAGDIKYKDLNHDGKIDGGNSTLPNHGDLKIIGNNQPRYLYNFRLGGSWKGFDIDAFFQGVGKRDWWGAGQTVYPLWQSVDILYANQLDFWTPTHTNARYPNPYPGNTGGTVSGLYAGSNNFYPQTKYLLNLAYCRLKNLTVGYSVTNRALTKAGITKLRFYFSGENLFTFSHVGVPIDPELTDASTTGGFTGRNYPFDKDYSVGAQLSF